MSDNTKVLDLGCGRHRHPNSVGIDINPNSNADIIHDLDVFPYPLADSEFDLIYADSIMEHLTDVMKVMAELHRITKPGGKIIIITPYFSSLDAFTDPTHKHYFSMRSFDYFTGDFPDFSYYSDARFKKLRTEITFWSLPRLGNVKPQHWFGANLLARHWPSIYERFFAYIFPAQEIQFELEVLK